MNDNQPSHIIDDPEQYGSKGQKWAPEFVAYMKEIVTHPAYAGMPDAVKEDGKIQWEAPSNRSGGNYQFTHNKRRDWWKRKASSIGIDINVDQWISRTAKTIHPTGEKPCKRCGNIMKIGYVYPKANLFRRFRKYFGESFEMSEMESIEDIVRRALDVNPNVAIQKLPEILSTKTISFPKFDEPEDLLEWLEDKYIPQESSLLSPGAMSNAPDRFDGFHSFNKCCRGKADSGRHASNLRSYSTDRRVFEFWSEGDWIAADRLMGLVKSKLRNESCADGGKGPPTADHIGPLSLGFCHRPEFRLLSKLANSAKNNRMTLWDVNYLRKREKEGISVISWHSRPIWDRCKDFVDNEEKALRISKLLRDNLRIVMRMLCDIYNSGEYAFLVYLLELSHADFKIEFKNLRVEDYLTVYDSIERVARTTKYSEEQKARRLRIGFEALRSYGNKSNRHFFTIEDVRVSDQLNKAIDILRGASQELLKLNDGVKKILFPPEGVIEEDNLRSYVKTFPTGSIKIYDHAKAQLEKAMNLVGDAMSALWETDRYVRDEFDLSS